MKNWYTENELQRIATEKAIELLQKDKTLLLNNTSYGGRGKTLVALTNNAGWGKERNVFISLKRNEDWFLDESYDLVVIEELDGEEKQLEVIMSLCRLNTKRGVIYSTDKQAYEKRLNRYRNRDKNEKVFLLEQGTEINNKFKTCIENKIRVKIKNQDIKITKRGNKYYASYLYRGIRKPTCLR